MIGELVSDIFMFESVNAQTDARTDGRTPARVPSYKLALSLGSGKLKKRAGRGVRANPLNHLQIRH